MIHAYFACTQHCTAAAIKGDAGRSQFRCCETSVQVEIIWHKEVVISMNSSLILILAMRPGYLAVQLPLLSYDTQPAYFKLDETLSSRMHVPVTAWTYCFCCRATKSHVYRDWL